MNSFSSVQCRVSMTPDAWTFMMHMPIAQSVL